MGAGGLGGASDPNPNYIVYTRKLFNLTTHVPKNYNNEDSCWIDESIQYNSTKTVFAEMDGAFHAGLKAS